MKIIVLVLASLFAFSSFSQLTGTYTVGGLTPDFATIGEACTQIETQGISGPVTMNIRDGVYADSIHLTAFSGASIVNTITFQSESMDAANVEITNGNTQPAYLDGETVDYITIKHLTLTAASNFSAVAIGDGVNNFTLTDCVVNGFSSNSFADANAAVRIRSFVFDNDAITISNNTINNGSYGIYFRNPDPVATVTITNNALNENYSHGIYLYEFGDIQITDNIINSSGAVIWADGIQMSKGAGEMTIERNEIYRTNQASGNGFNVSYLGGTAVFKNNIVSMPGNGCGAVRVDYIAADVAFYNNTFRVGSQVFHGFYDIELAIYNNILISTNGGNIYNISYNTLTFPPASNNNVCSTSGIFAYFDWPFNTTYGSLSDYQTGTGLDLNSFEITDFMFVDEVFDLHTCNDSLIGVGISLPSVIVDMDGEPRSMNSYSIGADYFNADGSLWNGGNLETCAGVPITLDAGAADSYLWSTLETTQAISATNFAQYTVEWTNVCGTYSDTVVINDITPVASFTNVQSFLTFQFTNTSQNGTSYLWDFGDGTTSTETNPMHVYSDLNTYTVTLTVTNACGTDVVTLQVTPSTVGLDELDVANVVVYPNPSNGVFQIKSDIEIDAISVHDAMGRIVFQANTTSTIDLSFLQNGIYYLELSSGENRILKRVEVLK